MVRYWIGLDCGGSATRGVLAGDALEIRARAEAGPGNPLSAGIDIASRSYRDAVRRLLGSARVSATEVAGIGLGAAGAGRVSEQKRIASVLRGLLPRARIRVDTDGLIALLGATRGGPGIIVIAGTGSFVLGIDTRGTRARGGGWGPILGDEGSGATLGRMAIQAVLRAEDGRARPTALRARVLRHFQVPGTAELVTRIYRDPPPAREFARLWPLLREESAAGDALARRILRQGGLELAETAGAVARRLDFGRREFPLVLTGGVLTSDSLLRRTLVRRLGTLLPRARLTAAAAPPEVGAIFLVKGLTGTLKGD